MKITMYELLGMVKDGEAPKKIKVYGTVYINNGCNCYLDENDKSLCNNLEIPMFLHDEIVILDNLEEKKIPEKLSTWFSVEAKQSKELNIEYANTNFENMYEKINEIINYLDYFKSKGDE